MNYDNLETTERIHEALEKLDTPKFEGVLTNVTPKIPGWVRRHMEMEHSRPSPSSILRCRYQQWCDGKGLEADQDIPVSWKLRRVMGIVSEPLWLAILALAGYVVTLPQDSYGCGDYMKAHPDGLIKDPGGRTDPFVPVEFKSTTGVGFKKMINGGGVAFVEPDHYAQVQLYMHATNTEAALYLSSTPDPGLVQADMRRKKQYGPSYTLEPFYVEWVAYDPNTVRGLLERAEMLWYDQQGDDPPMREYDGIPTDLKTGRRKMPCGYCLHLEKCNEQFAYGEGELMEEGVQWD